MQDSSTVLLRTIAETILACEGALIDEAGAHALPAFRACDKLRIPLRKVFGLGDSAHYSFEPLPWQGRNAIGSGNCE